MALNHSGDSKPCTWCKILSVTYKTIWQSGAFYVRLTLGPFKFGLPESCLLKLHFHSLWLYLPFCYLRNLIHFTGRGSSWPSLTVDFDLNLFADVHTHRCEPILSQTSARAAALRGLFTQTLSWLSLACYHAILPQLSLRDCLVLIPRLLTLSFLTFCSLFFFLFFLGPH